MLDYYNDNNKSLWYGHKTNGWNTQIVDALFDGIFGLKRSGVYKITDSDKEYKFEFDVAGVPKDKVDVNVDNFLLTVEAKNKDRYYKYSVHLAEDVNTEQVTAKVEDGILTVTIARGSPKRKRIEVI